MINVFFASLVLLSQSLWAGETLSGNKIDPRASLFITNVGVMRDFNNRHADKYSLGVLLGEVGERYRMNKNFGRNNYTLGQYMFRIFNEGLNDQVEYRKFRRKNSKSVSMGEPVPTDRSFAHLLKLWDDRLASGSLEKIKSLDELENGPFRMLAIVNRMDLAQDRDPRNNNEITFESRSFGELHIIYGLVDKGPEFEGHPKNPKPYPMVLVVSYRLPALNKSSKGAYFPVAEYTDTEDGPLKRKGALRRAAENPSYWKQKMKLWAERFAELSDIRSRRSGAVQFNARYKAKLKSILDDIVTPENFLSMKTNTKVTPKEHELREWYTIASTPQRFLIHRKLRREPHRCMQDSPELADLIEKYWVTSASYPESKRYLRGDLDMFSRNFDLGNGAKNQEFKAGYDILRDNERKFLSNRTVGRASNDTLRWESGTCGQRQSEMPYEMRPRLGSDDNQEKILMIPRFARVKNKGQIWKLPHLKGTSLEREKKRHAFAIRSCTGCHSQEGATKGFHIFNRLPGEESQLSPYLIGTSKYLSKRRSPLVPKSIDNSFSHGGVKYTYDTLKVRENWLHKALRKDIRMFENLVRPEFKNLSTD